jgi:ubiquinone/menaquinone biosynthesis C-methylase UbiE
MGEPDPRESEEPPGDAPAEASPSKAGAVFDQWAREGRDEGMAERHGVTAAPVLEAMDLEGTRLLDLGTGEGWAVREAVARDGTGVGVDASEEMLARARTRSGAGAAFVRADLEGLPFPEAAFGAAFSMEAMYYAADLGQALAEVRRVLEGGAGFHALVDYYEENEASHGWPEKTGLEMHRLPEEGWGRAVREAGFADVSVERVVAPAEADVAEWKKELGSLHVAGRAPH